MPASRSDPASVIARLHRAWNTHDLEAMAACFHADYESLHPCHPERSFKGRAILRLSWESIFNAIPDLQADLCRCAVVGNTVWAEWRWSGTHTSGTPYEAAGVMVFEVESGRIRRAHVYSETLQTSGPDWDRELSDLLERGETHP